MTLVAAPTSGAEPPPAADSAPAVERPASSDGIQGNQRILEVIPNYKTVEDPSQPVQPMTVKAKFKLGALDSFDPHALPNIAFYAGVGQLENQYKAWGQGIAGFGKRYAGAYADQAIGNMLGEAVFPSLLRSDPRYFRKAQGSFVSRAGYAVSRIVITRTDSGGRAFNFSEYLGNGSQAAISTLYHPAEDRTLHQVGWNIAFQTITDAGFNVVKEYWPDIRGHLLHKHKPASP